MKENYYVLDLFSGAGGMSEGFIQAGFMVPAATDYSKEASETYINRHTQLGYDIRFFTGDIRELLRNKQDLNELLGDTEFDVVVGGPPCQGFSLSGKRADDDERNLLFLEYLKAINIVKPKYFVMENVEGLLSYRFKSIQGLDGEEYENTDASEVIIKEAYKMGYMVKYKCLNAKDYGVPQNRPRVIFLGHKILKRGNGEFENVVTPPKFPIRNKEIVTVEDAISDLSFLKNGELKRKYDNRFGNKSRYQRSLRDGLTPSSNGNTLSYNIIHNHQASLHNEKTTNRFKILKPGETIGELLFRLSDDLKVVYSTKKYRCTKLHRKEVSPTVLTLPDDIVHYDPKNSRILSVRELARLQSFDDSFIFYGKRTTGGERRKYETPQYTQVGNAVPPLFAKAIAMEVMKALIETEKMYKNQLIGGEN
ncbi:DNA cytosine methyltransferase [Halalkalibacter nanhaiisediminis]|nr:DNA cytosine methyltransferase [Halalkalibacter nanhaiisediminis]